MDYKIFFFPKHIFEIHIYFFCMWSLQDFVHHCTAKVLEEVRGVYESHGHNPRLISWLNLWSDNCASQFKCVHTFGWARKFVDTHNLFAIVSISRLHTYVYVNSFHPYKFKFDIYEFLISVTAVSSSTTLQQNMERACVMGSRLL
jgi:hypothetical protein